MSYLGKNRARRRRRSLGDSDPWASTSSTPTTSSPDLATAGAGALSTIGTSIANLFGNAGSAAAAATPAQQEPSTVSKVGAGIAAFLSNLGKPSAIAPQPYPMVVPQSGISTTTVALLGGAAILTILLINRD